MSNQDFKYQCPACKKGFNKTARNEDKDVCCPRCEVLLEYRRGYDHTKKKPVGKYFLRKTTTHTESVSSTVEPILKLMSDPGARPEVHRVVDANGIAILKNVDYIVTYKSVFAEILYCPRCGKPTTKNNLITGGFEFFCKEPLDPRKHGGEKRKCRTRIRYNFTK